MCQTWNVNSKHLKMSIKKHNSKAKKPYELLYSNSTAAGAQEDLPILLS